MLVYIQLTIECFKFCWENAYMEDREKYIELIDSAFRIA